MTARSFLTLGRQARLLDRFLSCAARNEIFPFRRRRSFPPKIPNLS
jgi:hypothetical protein